MRNILHMDLNAFYASVEQALHPELMGLPVAVAGDKEKRNGIILTSSYEARACGVKTAMTVGEALKVCPNIIFIKPHYREYMNFSISVMDILRSYSPDVEIFSIDEAWIDVTGCERLFGNPREIGDKIRKRIKEELHITASVGVSYCKLVAKMASDMKKPDATTVIYREDIQNKIWPLPVKDLIGVGKRMNIMLNEIGIETIGDLACTQLRYLEKRFGKTGRYLWYFANGLDSSKVTSQFEEVKGVGNSVTTPRDMCCIEEASEILLSLSENVSRRLREQGLEGNVIEIMMKTKDFVTYTRQRKIYSYTCSTWDIHNYSLKLLSENWDKKTPIRLLGIRVTGLKPQKEYIQVSFFEGEGIQKKRKIDICMDKIREKHGTNSILRASLMVNESYKLSELESDEDSEIMNPFNGGIKI